MTIELTEQQRQAVQERAPEAVEVIDPRTQLAYVLIARERYQQLLAATREPDLPASGIPRSILRAQQAYWRDLPHLLSQRKLRGQWVCYHGDDRLGIGTYQALIRECQGRGLPDDTYHLDRILPRELPPWETEDVEPLGARHLDDSPHEP